MLKKMKKSVMGVLIIGTLMNGMLLNGCTAKEEPISQQELLGTWKTESMLYTDYITFEENYTFRENDIRSGEAYGFTIDKYGTYSFAANQLVLYNQYGTTNTYMVSRDKTNGDFLIFRYPDSDEEYVYERVSDEEETMIEHSRDFDTKLYELN